MRKLIFGTASRHQCFLGAGRVLLLRCLAAFLFLACTLLSGNEAQSQAPGPADWVVNLSDAGYDPIPAGGTIVYKATVSNGLVATAPVNTLRLTIPVGMVFTGATGTITGCTPTSATGPATIVCNVPSLTPKGTAGDKAELFASVRTTNSGAPSVTANVPTLNIDTEPANNTVSQNTTVTLGADLQLSVTGPATAASGSTVSYTFTIGNNGPHTAVKPVITVPSPPGLANITPPPGCTLASNAYTCTVSNVLSGGSTTLTFTGQVTNTSVVNVNGSVSALDPADPISTNNSASTSTTTTPGSDLAIKKVRSPEGPLIIGSTVTFTLSPTFTGTVPSNITVSDDLPANYKVLGVSAGASWSCQVAGRKVTCTRATVSGGGGSNVSLGNIVITAEAEKAGFPDETINVATITPGSPSDPELGNNGASDGGVLIAEPKVDLVFRKSAPSPPVVMVGQSFAWRLGTSNQGTVPFFGTIEMYDDLPAGMNVVEVKGNTWTCNPSRPPIFGPVRITCTKTYTQSAPLAVGQTAPVVDIVVNATQAGNFTNTGCTGSPNGNTTEITMNNNCSGAGAGAEGIANSASLKVLKTARLASVQSGEIQTFDIELVNEGPKDATKVVLTDELTTLINNTPGPESAGTGIIVDPLPAGVTCVYTTAVNFRSRLMTCDIARVPVCRQGVDCPKLSFRVGPGSTSSARTNTAKAYSQEVPDPNLVDNESTAPYRVTPGAEVTIKKSANPITPQAGTEVTFSIVAEVINDGRSEAENVTITDPLPANMTFISATPTAGSCGQTPTPGTTTGATSNNLVVCNLGMLMSGGRESVSIVARPNYVLRNQTITNTGTVSTTTPGDVTSNNSASISLNVRNPALNLVVNKTDSVDPVFVTRDTVYTITAGNTGPSAAENVVITDRLPTSRLSFVSNTVPAGGTCDPPPAVGSLGGTLICRLPRLAMNENVSFTVTMRGASQGVTSNTAEITSDEVLGGFETTPSNNTITEQTTVSPRVDVAVESKTASPSSVGVGQPFNYTIVVTNADGEDFTPAASVLLSDNLPTGMEMTGAATAVVNAGTASTNSCTGSPGATSFTCNFGTMSKGARITITLPVRITATTSSPQVFTNTASVTTTSFDTDTANNANSGNVTVGSSSISGLVFRDFNNSGTQDAGDTGVAGVLVTLTGTFSDNTPASLTASTGADGRYEFSLRQGGTFTITRGPVSENSLVNSRAIPGTVSGTPSGAASGATIINTITVPGGASGVNYNFTLVPIARIGIAKALLAAPVVNADGTFDATFRLRVKNYSTEPLANIDVTDSLQGAFQLFGNHASGAPTFGQYTVTQAPTGTCGGLNASFNGATVPTVAGGFRLESGVDCRVEFTIRVNPVRPLPALVSQPYLNQATVTGTGEISGQTSAINPQLSDLSQNGSEPDPNNNGTANEPGENTPTPVAVQYPAIGLVKAAGTLQDVDNDGRASAGDRIAYTFQVSNLGNVTLTSVRVTDTKIASISCPVTVLAIGGSTNCTGSYTLIQADVDAGQVENTATAFGTSPENLEVSDVSDQSVPGAGNERPTVTPIPRLYSLAIVKTVDKAGPVQVGETLSYTITATNTGNTTQTNVLVADNLITPSSKSCPTVAPGGTCVLTGTYVVKTADAGAGKVDNTAQATSTEVTTPVTASTSTPVVQTRSLSIVKTVDKQGPVQVGETLSYTITATNTGNTTQTNVLVQDNLITPSSKTCASVAPGGTCVLTGTYVTKTADADAGKVDNTAQAKSTEVPTPVSAGTSTPVVQTRSLSIVKTVDKAGPVQVGETLSYTITATNTGNTTQTNVLVQDNLITPSSKTCASVAPGGTCVLTGTYVTATKDADAGKVDNTAQATSKEVTTPVTAGTSTPVVQTRSLSIDKTVDKQRPVQVGETLTYTITATNTGNTTQTNVLVQDNLITPLSKTCASVAPGGTCVLTGTYIVKASDGDTGKVDNTAQATSTEVPAPVTDSTSTPVVGLTIVKTVDKAGPVQVGETLTYTITATNTAKVPQTNMLVSDNLITPSSKTCATVPPGGTCVLTGTYVTTTADADAGTVDNTAQATSTEVPTPVTDSTSTPVEQIRSLSLEKEVDKQGPVQVGETLSYAITATNTGNTTQTNVLVADNLITPSSKSCPTVAPGGTCVLTGTYVVKTADAGAGKVDNTAQATSTEVTTPVTASTSTPVVQIRSLSIVKTVDKAGPVQVGETLSYTITATNTGNTNQTNVLVTDNLITPSSRTCASVAPGGTCVLTGTYVTKTADADAGKVDNTAQATSTEVPTPVTDGTSTPVVQTRSLSIVKTVDKTGPVTLGETLSYTITATNTGNTTQTDVLVEDNLITPSSTTCATVLPGGTCVLTGTYVVQLPDGDAGTVDNTAQATSTEVPTPVTDSTSTPVEQTRSLSIVKTVDKTGPVQVGETLTYTITATNTGSTTQTDVLVEDNLITPSSTTCATVPSGGTCVLTGTYVTTTADADAGKVDNTAQATSTEVPTPVTDGTSTPVEQTRSLSIVKRVDKKGPVPVGATLTYTIVATNTGNTTQTNVRIEDNLITPSSTTCATVLPGGTCVLTGTYVVQETDREAGKVDNTAEATSTEVPVPVDDSTSTPVIVITDVGGFTKKALVTEVKRGERVPYVITATAVPFSPVRIVDIMPPGFAYVDGSATSNSAKIDPAIDGRTLTFDGLTPDTDRNIKLELTLVATANAATGDNVNQAQIIDPATGEVKGTARARVTILEEAMFDCSDVIGKVFDDKNRNGYQDDGEPGLPGVRLATVKGLLVTTDKHGRFSIACADIPDQDIGSNFLVKLDPRTLPTGYRITTENPRKVRLTRGKVVKLNFGAAITRLVSLDVNDKVFQPGSGVLRPKWQAGLSQLVAALEAEPSSLRITYVGEGGKLAKQRIRAVSQEIEKLWGEKRGRYRLSIETRIVSSGGEAGQ